MSKYPIVYSGRNTAEFVLSEAQGQRSRDNAYLADPVTVTVGMPLKKTVEATTDKFATYTVAAVGADCHALALYAGTSVAVEGLKIAVLSRDAEVNFKLVNWGAMSNAEKAAGVTALAARGIIVRD